MPFCMIVSWPQFARVQDRDIVDLGPQNLIVISLRLYARILLTITRKCLMEDTYIFLLYSYKLSTYYISF